MIMQLSGLLAILLQIVLVVWLLGSLHIKKSDNCLLDQDSTAALKGYFSIVIVLFHTPVSNVLYNLLGCVSAVVIVTLFSFFSTYGMMVKMQEQVSYINTIPFRFIKIVSVYVLVLVMKYCITGEMFTGGILWINCLLLSYLIIYTTYRMIPRGGIELA